MKKVPKILLDSFLDVTRSFWKNGDSVSSELSIDIARLLQKYSGIDWSCWKDLANSIFCTNGFKEEAKNEQFYEILKILGVEVVDE